MNQLSVVFTAKKPDFDPNTVTPGVAGFIAIFLIIVVVVLLVMDMVRRIRRNQYRAEIGERLDAEAAASARADGDAATDTTPSDPIDRE